MTAMNFIFHLPPVWLPESRTLALEASADGEKIICLIPSDELRRRFNTKPDLGAMEAQVVFETFRDDLEMEIRSLVESHRWPSAGEQVRAPRVLHLGALSATPVGVM